MKKALLMLAFMAGLASCKKDYPDFPTLNGTWELNKIISGFGPTVVVPDDKKDRYVITINSKYVRKEADKTETKGNFTVKFTGEHNGYRYGNITFSNPQYTDAFAFKADTIIIGTSAADGPSYKYIRIKK